MNHVIIDIRCKVYCYKLGPTDRNIIYGYIVGLFTIPWYVWKSHSGDKTIIWSSYLHNWISCTGPRLRLAWLDINRTPKSLIFLEIFLHVIFQEGWSGGFNCPDNIDECANATNPCGPNSQCLDTDGSYECSCLAGYQLDVNSICQGICKQVYFVKYLWSCDI